MAVATKPKRVRITQQEIDRARQEILSPSQKPVRAKVEKEKPKWGKDFWHGLVYCDSYGHAWISGEQFEPIYLGKTDEIIPCLKDKGIDGENVDMVLIAVKEFRTEKETQSCHLAMENDVTSISIPTETPNRATFRDDTQFLSLLDGLIAKGYGTPTIQRELGNKGYDIPYRTLGRWVSKRRTD